VAAQGRRQHAEEATARCAAAEDEVAARFAAVLEAEVEIDGW
jgi:hypothetical protein